MITNIETTMKSASYFVVMAVEKIFEIFERICLFMKNRSKKDIFITKRYQMLKDPIQA